MSSLLADAAFPITEMLGLDSTFNCSIAFGLTLLAILGGTFWITGRFNRRRPPSPPAAGNKR